MQVSVQVLFIAEKCRLLKRGEMMMDMTISILAAI